MGDTVWSVIVIAGCVGCGGGSSASDAQSGGLTVTTAASIPLTGKPNGVSVFDPATKLVYEGLYNNGSPPTSAGIVVIDTTTNQIKTTISTTDVVGGLALNPTTHTIYATASSFSGPPQPTVYVIDAMTQTLTSTFHPGSSGQISAAVAVHPTTNTIYVLNNDFAAQSGKIAVVDGTNNTVTTTITVPMTTFQSGSATIQPAMNKLYAVGQKYNDQANVIANEIDTTTNTVTSSMPYAGNLVNVTEVGTTSAAIALNGDAPAVDVLDPFDITFPPGAYVRSVTGFAQWPGFTYAQLAVVYCKDGREWDRTIGPGTMVRDVMTDLPCPHASSTDPESCPSSFRITDNHFDSSHHLCFTGDFFTCDNMPCDHRLEFCDDKATN